MEHRTRNIHVGTRLNEAEYEELKDLCKRTGLGNTRLLRKLITETEIRAKPSPELRDLRRAIDRIGNDINQIAHRANTVGIIDRAEWNKVKALLASVKAEVHQWQYAQRRRSAVRI